MYGSTARPGHRDQAGLPAPLVGHRGSLIDSLLAYLPQDRRAALLRGQTLPAHCTGAALFADISGFTPLTEAFTTTLGPRRGGAALLRQINQVYEALIAPVDQNAGSVIDFAVDAIPCWFVDYGTAIQESLSTMYWDRPWRV